MHHVNNSDYANFSISIRFREWSRARMNLHDRDEDDVDEGTTAGAPRLLRQSRARRSQIPQPRSDRPARPGAPWLKTAATQDGSAPAECPGAAPTSARSTPRSDPASSVS